jgi:hypothetical protein
MLSAAQAALDAEKAAGEKLRAAGAEAGEKLVAAEAEAGEKLRAAASDAGDSAKRHAELSGAHDKVTVSRGRVPPFFFFAGILELCCSSAALP